jgi:histidinol-phosphate/aromatic aminotransferase/cobyric acid decarboxylase-like protein
MKVEELARRFPGVVLVDEAYVDFARTTASRWYASTRTSSSAAR